MKKNNHSRGRPLAPVSVRLSAEERQELERAAKGKSLSAYIRTRLFGADDENVKTIRISAHERQKLLAQILSTLGKSEYAASLRELAEAAKGGALPLSPDVLDDIQNSIKHIESMRSALLKALGIKLRGRS